MKAETLAKKKETEDRIAALTPAAKPASAQSEPPPPTPPAEKWKREDHPAFRKTAPALEVTLAADANDDPKPFKVNDTVSAKYAGDKTFYPATVISVTGSASAPIYTVKFKGYSGTETVRAHEIRALSSSSSSTVNNPAGAKRKADGSPAITGSPAPATSATPINNGSTISAAAKVDHALADALRNQPSKVSDGPRQPERVRKKVKTNKALETAKSSWQSFQKKSVGGKVGKVTNKESMFRTGESATAKGIYDVEFRLGCPQQLT